MKRSLTSSVSTPWSFLSAVTASVFKKLWHKISESENEDPKNRTKGVNDPKNINKIPLSMAILYGDALREFSYMEYSETGREEINIESGESHIRLFNAVLPAMFEEVVEIVLG